MAVFTKSLGSLGLIVAVADWHPVGAGPTSGAPQTATDSVQRARALHVLNRLAFGPRPGEVDRVATMGVDQYIEQQLGPQKINDDELARHLARLDILRTSREELARIFLEEQRARQQRQRAAGPDSATQQAQMRQERPEMGLPRSRRLAAAARC